MTDLRITSTSGTGAIIAIGCQGVELVANTIGAELPATLKSADSLQSDFRKGRFWR